MSFTFVLQQNGADFFREPPIDFAESLSNVLMYGGFGNAEGFGGVSDRAFVFDYIIRQADCSVFNVPRSSFSSIFIRRVFQPIQFIFIGIDAAVSITFTDARILTEKVACRVVLAVVVV